jgi:HEAT repeat protein
MTLLAGLAAAAGAADTAPAESPEVKLIAVLQSNAAPQEKAITCKRLAICGTKAAVPALAALLSDEKLASWARIGLEAIPDPAVDAALREAAEKLQGKLQIGVVNSIGERRDEKALAWLSQKLKDADPALVSAAAAALGRIGGETAAQALGQALAGASAATLPAICEGALRAADIFIAQSKHDKAAQICEQVRTAQTPRHIRMEAMRSLIVARQAAGIPLLIEQLKSDDAGMVAVAMGLAHDLPGAALTQALTTELNQLPPEKQVYVIEALGVRLDKTVVPTLLALTTNSSANVGIAAIGALTKLGDASVLPRFVAIATAPDIDVAKAAQSALVKFPAPEADATCIAMLASNDARTRLSGADIISRRATYSAMPAVAKVAREDADPAVRAGCINALRELGSLTDLPALVEILVKNQSEEEAQSAEKAMATICGRQTDRTACAEKLIAGLASAQPAQKCALLRLLRSVVDAKSLQAIRAAMADANKEVQDAATRLICEWSTVEAAPDLLALAKTSPNPTYKLLALRGYMRVSGEKDVPAAQRLTMCMEAADLVQRNDERKILLGVLGTAGDGSSLALAAMHLDNAALKAEACLACVAIAERLVKDWPDGVLPVMVQVLKLNPDDKLTARANAVLKAAKEAAGKGTSLFNGKDLSGWEGAPGWWSVEEGALTSQSTAEKPCTECNYLVWKGAKPADFELTCDFKLSAAANSGVQIRSETRPNWDTYGYQADMTGDGSLVGFVYHHARGLIGARGEKVTITTDGKKEVEKIGDAAELLKNYKSEAWNTYRIVCHGPDITLYVNGVLMCQITDHDASTAGKGGIIALQMHPGPPMKVQFKNINLKELK